MKKAKVVLMSLVVLAAVGGAVAFKAKKHIPLYCGPTPTLCPTLTDIYTPTVQNPLDNTYCTFDEAATTCPIRVTFEQ